MCPGGSFHGRVGGRWRGCTPPLPPARGGGWRQSRLFAMNIASLIIYIYFVVGLLLGTLLPSLATWLLG